MDTRKRLIELLLKCDNDPNLAYYDMSEITDKMMGGAEYLADYLIENGVTFTKKSPHRYLSWAARASFNCSLPIVQ